jgi:hypothetical protein
MVNFASLIMSSHFRMDCSRSGFDKCVDQYRRHRSSMVYPWSTAICVHPCSRSAPGEVTRFRRFRQTGSQNWKYPMCSRENRSKDCRSNIMRSLKKVILIMARVCQRLNEFIASQSVFRTLSINCEYLEILSEI